MQDSKNQLEHLGEIRQMMRESSKFLSLSGISGVWVGSVALIGMAVAFFQFQDYFILRYSFGNSNYTEFITELGNFNDFLSFVLIDAFLILLISLIGAFAFSYSKANKKGLNIWCSASKRFLFSLALPLIVGGIFGMGILVKGYFDLAAGVALVFYGLALYNAGRYSVNEIRVLGLIEIALGIISIFVPGYSAILLAIGFGVLHIVYGILMYFKYDK